MIEVTAHGDGYYTVTAPVGTWVRCTFEEVNDVIADIAAHDGILDVRWSKVATAVHHDSMIRCLHNEAHSVPA